MSQYGSRWPVVLAVFMTVAGAVLNVTWIRAQAQSDTTEPVSGLWEIQPADAADLVQLRLCYADAFAAAAIPASRLDGFSPAWLRQDGRIPLFTLRRDAGTFTFEGSVHSGRGLGTYTFAPAADFLLDFEKRGFTPPTGTQQARWPGLGTWTHTLAMHDIGLPFFDELKAQGVAHPDFPEIVRSAQFRGRLDDMFGVRHATVPSERRWC